MAIPYNYKNSLLLALLILVLPACSTIISPRTAVDYKRGYDFEQIRTAAFAPHEQDNCFKVSLTPEETARIDEAIRAAMQDRGLTVVGEMAAADLIIDWHVVTEEMTDVRAYNANSYYQCWRCGPAISDLSVTSYTMGTFIIDLIDPDLSKSVWRGVIKGRLPPKPDTAEREARYREAAERIFSSYPP